MRTSGLLNKIIGILFAQLLLLQPPAQADFTAVEPLGTISKIGPFPMEDYTPEGDVFELKNRMIENQLESEECYLFAAVNYLQVANRNRYSHPSAPGLSGPHLFAVKMLEYIDQSLDLEEARYSLKGGNLHEAFELISKYGMIPDAQWKPQVPFYLWPIEDLYKEIETKVRAAQSSLRKIASREGEDSQGYQSALQRAREEAHGILFKLTGPLPEKFEWDGQEWTVHSFASMYGIEQARSFEMLVPRGLPLFMDEQDLRGSMRSSINRFGGRFSLREKSWDQIENEMVKALHKGIPVPVGVKWGRSGHILTAIGYESRKGRVFAWKFLNSWGRWTKDGTTFYRASDVRLKADQIWIID